MKKQKKSFFQNGLIRVIFLYQQFSKIVLTPMGFGTACCFTPTCSVYMCEAIRRYGTIDGLSRGFSRILRCHPFSRGGYDPA